MHELIKLVLCYILVHSNQSFNAIQVSVCIAHTKNTMHAYVQQYCGFQIYTFVHIYLFRVAMAFFLVKIYVEIIIDQINNNNNNNVRIKVSASSFRYRIGNFGCRGLLHQYCVVFKVSVPGIQHKMLVGDRSSGLAPYTFIPKKHNYILSPWTLSTPVRATIAYFNQFVQSNQSLNTISLQIYVCAYCSCLIYNACICV
eukprot:TRINITY_DN5785_c0_g2_i4.p3 TRINITY_DN5785_c0_g2~~TRINITY_DN5785_c0_g2_i4.p3  ORF type:complete len:199 (-),score=-14.19 TRINITY_DN5785_c0_g2_i4:1140-1736(-)